VKLDGQVALVTGGSRGLGFAIAGALAREGAAVACVARGGAELDGAIARLTAQGARAVAAAADVTRESDVAAAVASARGALGRLDILVLNAGTWQGSPIVKTSEAQWDQLLDLNLKGAFLTLKHGLPHLIERGGGTVVGIGSLGGLVGQPGSAAYAASKWGLRGLLESAALEVKPHHIRVSIIHPHQINSTGGPVPDAERNRKLETDDIASLVTFVCAAPPHVAIGHVTIWPLEAGVRDFMR
jgi:NAD(P)-dependent dehydrogenase (short-subunit alcohol dehydrogenase family)